MSLITWNDSFSVNVRKIDQQHQQLIVMLNELHDAMKAGHGKDVLGKILTGLIGYTTTHFKEEERCFAQFEYPDTVQHKREHTAFIQKVSEFKSEFEQGRLTVSIEVLFFLRDWLEKHIKGADKKYGPFFNEKGLK